VSSAIPPPPLGGLGALASALGMSCFARRRRRQRLHRIFRAARALQRPVRRGEYSGRVVLRAGLHRSALCSTATIGFCRCTAPGGPWARLSRRRRLRIGLSRRRRLRIGLSGVLRQLCGEWLRSLWLVAALGRPVYIFGENGLLAPGSLIGFKAKVEREMKRLRRAHPGLAVALMLRTCASAGRTTCWTCCSRRRAKVLSIRY
jgi:hypothetical protein